MIKVKHLSKSYGERQIIDDISFTIEKGKIYGFLGPNGAGKSTTMNMLTGYLAPSKGSITVAGVDMLKNPEKAKKHIGYLPEIPPLYMDMKVEEYLDFVAEIKGVPGKSYRKEEAVRVMEMMSLLPVSDRLIKNISKGYKQRVGFAAALLGRPEILILDEPTVGLDPEQIVEIRNLMKRLSHDHTVILSTHILSEVSAVCDKILILSGGKLVANDTAADLVARYNEKQIFEIVLKGTASGAEKLFSSMSEIEEYQLKAESNESCTIKVTVRKGLDIREKIFGKCKEFGFVILELNVLRVTLEDVYLKLTRAGNYYDITKEEEESYAGDL